jgi:hypothetical protein
MRTVNTLNIISPFIQIVFEKIVKPVLRSTLKWMNDDIIILDDLFGSVV